MAEGIISGNIRGVPFHQPVGRESSVREINLQFNEFWDYRIFRFFETWKSIAVNRFDYSQNLDAMIPSGVSVVCTDSDRKRIALTYKLYDIVCTKCNLGGEFNSENDIMKTQVSLKFGHFDIIAGDGTDINAVNGNYSITAM